MVAPNEEKRGEGEKAEPREIGQWNRYIMAPTPALAHIHCTHTHTHLSRVIVIYNNNSNDWHCVCSLKVWATVPFQNIYTYTDNI